MAKKCSVQLKSRRVQRLLKASWRAYMDDQVLNHGGVEKNAWANFKNDFHRGFMTACRTRRTKASTKVKEVSPFGRK